MPDLELVVAGDGPEAERLKQLAGPNVSLTPGFVSDERLRELMATSRAFIFAAEEDFGIIVVEAQSERTGACARRPGGARESISTALGRPTGMFFEKDDPNIDRRLRSLVRRERANDCALRLPAARQSVFR